MWAIMFNGITAYAAVYAAGVYKLHHAHTAVSSVKKMMTTKPGESA